MSTRWYPLYQKGNPQLRVFLPNFWMKLVKPYKDSPPNVVQFHCSMEMTRHDVKNYLEKIYNIKTVEIRTRIQQGKTKLGYPRPIVTKEDDYKVAYAVLPKNESFVYPDLFDTEAQKREKEFEESSFDEMKVNHKKFLAANNKPGVPGWFSI